MPGPRTSDEHVVIDITRPFRRRTALRIGFDPGRRPTGLQQVFKGVWVGREVPLDDRTRIMAALALHHPTAFVSHQSCAALRGLPIPHCERPHISVLEQGHRTQRLEIAVHLACAESRVESVDGLRVSEPLDLFVELAGELPLLDVVVVGDAMVRRELFTPEELRRFCASTSRRHVRKARRAAAYVRSGVDSPMESRLRMLLVLAGLPEPRVNFKILFDSGEVRYRLDLSFPDLRIVIEYDGRQHAEDPAQWRTDLERREELEALGWLVIVVTSDGLFRVPQRTIVRVARALSRRGRPVRHHQGWRAHFQQR